MVSHTQLGVVFHGQSPPPQQIHHPLVRPQRIALIHGVDMFRLSVDRLGRRSSLVAMARSFEDGVDGLPT
jgi:hypothetical protein